MTIQRRESSSIHIPRRTCPARPCICSCSPLCISRTCCTIIQFPSTFVLPERSALLASLLRRSLAAPAALQRCLAKKTRQRRWQDGWVPSEGGVWDGEYQKYRSNQTHVPYHRMRTSVCQSISHIGAQIHLTRALQFHDSGYGWHGGVCRCVVTVTQSHERNGLVRVQELRSEHIRV